VAEVQKAMALAEKRALDSVSEERVKMERILLETNNNNNNNNNLKFNSENLAQPETTHSKDQVVTVLLPFINRTTHNRHLCRYN
jgi:hypothetical protein